MMITMARNKPSVRTQCPANAYTAPNERIVEFSSPGGGGLISFRTFDGPDGTKLHVSVYQQDPTVEVTIAEPRGR